jgi:hypothetical protein
MAVTAALWVSMAQAKLKLLARMPLILAGNARRGVAAGIGQRPWTV